MDAGGWWNENTFKTHIMKLTYGISDKEIGITRQFD